jgi:hypothetical protein
MNLKQKEELKANLDSLDELLRCVPKELIYEHSIIVMQQSSNALLGHLIAIQCGGDRLLALNFLLRMLKDTTHQIKGELEL